MNALAALTVLGALASPFLRAAGLDATASRIDALYSYICPQRPSHSFFLLGHQVPLEQRMLAMAAAQLVGGVLYGWVRGRVRPLDWRIALALVLPMAIDGFSQTLGLRDSTWLLRALTGTLATLAFVFWAYPHLDRFLADAASLPDQARG